MNNFNDLGLPQSICEALALMQITSPTPVQAGAIPHALNGDDVLAFAQTGSGKTLAYLLPMATRFLASKERNKALILLPTRELAIQVNDSLVKISGKSNKLRSAVLIGGDSMFKQISQLKRNPSIIIGTPGRICDHIQRKTLDLSDINFLVFDEIDRMLDVGFSEQIDLIHKNIPENHQTLMFSATLPPYVMKISQKYLKDPKNVAIGSAVSATENVEQQVIHITQAEKFPKLLAEIEGREGSIIVFVKTKLGAEKLARELRNKQHSTDFIHGDLQQRRRERVVHAFRKEKNRIMVATDVAARGLDIPHIKHVINYDLPSCPEDYVHRVGRTGRAGAKGFAISFVSPEDKSKWRSINNFMNPKNENNSDHGRREKHKKRPSGKRFFGNKRRKAQ